jgi:Kef-type K+ transport system membrane component KefB
LAITAAAIEDVVSWVLLAIAVATSRSNTGLGALTPLVGTAAWSWFLLVGLRPLRLWLEARYRDGHQLGPLLQASLFGGALLSAAVTEWLGVHLIFGAFLWGLAMPRYEPLRRRLELRLDAVVLQLLLPLFFAISGLSTQIGSLNTPALWGAAALVLAVAVGGKFIGTWAVARASGMPEREAQAMGWLMNTRGLTELVILNVGLELGVISTELFTMGVLMALVTTVMAGPLLGHLGYKPAKGAS